MCSGAAIGLRGPGSWQRMDWAQIPLIARPSPPRKQWIFLPTRVQFTPQFWPGNLGSWSVVPQPVIQSGAGQHIEAHGALLDSGVNQTPYG